MAIKLESLELRTDYRTDRNNPVNDFYEPCLKAANFYSRAVGYFRSSIFLLTGPAVIDFVKSGGRIRLICSPHLTKGDIDAITTGAKDYQQISLERITEEIDSLLGESIEQYPIKILATLIKVGALEVKIALRDIGDGIYHEKLGIFQDERGSAVSFIGSANETFNAWHEQGNFESIEVFCSWKGQREFDRVMRHVEDFQALWFGTANGIKTVNIPDAIREKLFRIAEDDINSIDFSKINRNPQSSSKKIKITKVDNLLPHQANAISLWKGNSYRGVFEHATGSGKTVTALAAIKEHISNGDCAIVLVPSKLLLKQWIKEATEEIEDCLWLAVGAGNNLWRKNNKLKNFLSDNIIGMKRLVIATMQTASTDEFLSQIPPNSNLLLVADEVHQIGSDSNSKALAINAEKRLGLSATPIRYGDVDGTKKIFNYFGDVIKPVITLYDAIQAGRLVDYEYFPHIVNLSASEADEWKKLSKDISKEIAISNNEDGPFRLSNKAKMLLIARSRIAKKSSVKINLAKQIIQQNYKQGHKWLIYCEDQEQLKSIASALIEIDIHPLEYYSHMDGDSSETLKLFETQGGVLVSIRCLDEGVDIPSISHALILASSQNPRQFIQRRGRVLRRHPSKIYASIHDAIVVPISLEDEPEQFALLKSELVRAHEFSRHAMNKSGGYELEIIAGKLSIDLSEVVNDGVEEEVNDE